MEIEDSPLLKEIGFHSTDELFQDVPQKIRKKELKIPRGISEFELTHLSQEIASMNRSFRHNFLGNGIYDRIIPSSVDSIIGRSEFLTSYTPYQAEMSQGMLQSLFEFQSIISDLTGMDITNSSMYDGFTALGEAARMAYRINEGSEILVPETMYRSKLNVLHSYMTGLNVRLVPYGISPADGTIDLESLEGKINDNTSAIIAEQPSSLGNIDRNVAKISEIKKKALLITYYDPIALGVLKPPGETGSDINVMEGQQLGLHRNLGGPLLGILSFRNEFARKSPGRIIGESNDTQGKRAFVMTLQTREQHIRRAKAMSNICTNQALFAVAATSYLGIIGPSGLKKIALKTMENSQKLINSVSRSKMLKRELNGVPFSDVILKYSGKGDLQHKLAESGIAGGIELEKLIENPHRQLKGSVFLSVTEKTGPESLEALSKAIEVIQ
jgi:glycine dehydrogenase subunit 1